MRLTPAQCGMHSLLGHWLPMGMSRDWSLADRIRHGREFLVRITRQDFGYDAMRWHNHLWDTDAGGYRWARRGRDKWARQVEAAVSSPEWQAAVAALRGAQDAEPVNGL